MSDVHLVWSGHQDMPTLIGVADSPEAAEHLLNRQIGPSDTPIEWQRSSVRARTRYVVTATGHIASYQCIEQVALTTLPATVPGQVTA